MLSSVYANTLIYFCPRGTEMEALQLQDNMFRYNIADQDSISLVFISKAAMHSKRKIEQFNSSRWAISFYVIMLPLARALVDMHSAGEWIIQCQILEIVLEIKWWLQLKLMGRDGTFPSPHLVPIIRADDEIPFYSLNLTFSPVDMAQLCTSESLRTVREYCEPCS